MTRRRSIGTSNPPPAVSAGVFRNYGGNYQLRVETADDLALIQVLRPARWAATSVPVESLQCDPAFLGYLSADGSGRIRPEQLRAAIRWLFHRLAKRDRVAEAADALRLADLDVSHEAGRKLRDAATHILRQPQAPHRDTVSLKQVRAFRDTYALAPPNGDGVLPPSHVSDPAAAGLASDVLAHVGGSRDVSGKDGVTESHLSEFLTRAKVLLAWKARGKGDGAGEVLPWGDDTREAAALVAELDGKIEQFFWQCDLVAFDARGAERTGLSERTLRDLDSSDPQAIEAALAAAPLQAPDADGVLDLAGVISPPYRRRVADLVRQVLTRAKPDLRGRLQRSAWQEVKAIFEPYWTWQAEKPGSAMDALDDATLRGYVDGPTQETLQRLLRQDLAVADELQQIHDLEKLILYQRWLVELANNIVNFSALYTPGRRGLFEMGDLIIDGRELAFTVKVRDRAAHRVIAATSKMFVVYAEITARDDVERRFEIAAGVTAGSRGGIAIGKRGVFCDLEANEWDARVVDIVENPISLWEAIKAPFVRVKELLARKAEGFIGARAQSLETAATDVATRMEQGESLERPHSVAQRAAADAAATTTSGMRDLLLGGGIAFAAVGSSLAYLITTLSQISLPRAGLALVSLVLVVALFSALLGWNKLRRRDMSAILEACGWAVNFRMYMTHRLGDLFTRTPGVPHGARVERPDLVSRFLRQPGSRATRAIRVGLLLLLAVVVVGVLLAVIYWADVQALLRRWQ